MEYVGLFAQSFVDYEHRINAFGQSARELAFSQAIILTHEDTPKQYYDTYLADRLRPLKPLLSFGRAAKQAPVVKAYLAVWSWWQDFVVAIKFDLSINPFADRL